MLAWLRRLLGPPEPPTPRLSAVLIAVAELEDRVDWLAADFKKLRGRVTGGQKKSAPEEEPAEPENDGDAPQALQHHPPGSAHLAARFRRF